MRFTKVAVAASIGAVALGGCSLSGQTHQSAQAGATDHSAAQVIQMPSGFRNVAIKCVELQGNWYAVASTSDGGNGDNLPAAPAIALAPHCRSYGP